MSKLVICAVVAYLLGNISPSIIMSRLKGSDIREHGSGNAGTTNMLRTYGKKAAALTLVIDVIKGAAAVLIGRAVGGETGACVAVVAVICGHIWPCFYGFKGGKGVAASLGALLALSPRLALAVAVIAIAVMAVTRMVSAGSVAAAVSLPFLSLWLARPFFPFSVVMALIVIFKHRSNIGRIMRGEESKLDFSKYK